MNARRIYPSGAADELRIRSTQLDAILENGEYENEKEMSELLNERAVTNQLVHYMAGDNPPPAAVRQPDGSILLSGKICPVSHTAHVQPSDPMYPSAALFADTEADRTQGKLCMLRDDDGDLELLFVHNYDSNFLHNLQEVCRIWHESDGEFSCEVYTALAEKGYVITVLPYQVFYC